MKIVITADLHLNKSNHKGIADREMDEVSFRNADFMRSFQWICDKSINEIHPDLFIVVGDVYDGHSPSNIVRGFFSKQIGNLLKNNIPCMLLTGNHDTIRTSHSIQDIKELGLKFVKVIDQPICVNFKDKHFMIFPYSLDIERNIISPKASFKRFIEKHKNCHSDPDNTILLAHMGVVGAKKNEFLEEVVVTDEQTLAQKIMFQKKDFINTDWNDIDLQDLDDCGAKYVYLGDYHRFQTLPTKNCYSMYSGSIERTDFSEVDQIKGFLVHDDDLEEKDGVGKATFIEYPHCRHMLELTGTYEEMCRQFEKIDPLKYHNAVVKLEFIGKRNELFAFSSHLDDLKTNIVAKTNAIHIFNTQKITDDKKHKEATAIEKQIIASGHLGVSEVLSVVKEDIQRRMEPLNDPEELKRSMELAEEIFNTVKIKHADIRS